MLICLSGPSGIGKGFVKEGLLRLYPGMKELVWQTTRALRPNESGGNRAHISHEEFRRMEVSGELVLVQNLFGHQYGLRKEDFLDESGISITEIHPYNIEDTLAIRKSVLAIGFITPDLSLLRERLAEVRKTETPEEIEQRVAMAEIEIQAILNQHSSYSVIIEVTKETESEVLDTVRQFIQIQLKRKGWKT